MRIRRLLVTFFVLALFPATGLCAAGPFITLEGGGKSVSLTAEEISGGKEATMDVAMGKAAKKGGPDQVTFLLRRGSPNGINLIAIHGDTGENLLGTIPQTMQGFDDYGELTEGFSLQVAVRDLNGDKKPDVLVATGDGVAILSVAVFVYTPQGNERFRCIGVIEGQKTLHVAADGLITAPWGSQGRFTEYRVTPDGMLAKRE